VAPAGLALRVQANPASQLVVGLPYGQKLTAVGAEGTPDATGRAWQQVRTDAGQTGFVAARLGSERYLSTTEPPAPYVVQVLDAPEVRAANGLALRDRRDVNASVLDRAAIGERLTVYTRAEEGGSAWLWALSPRGAFGWVRESSGGAAFVNKVEGAAPTQPVSGGPQPTGPIATTPWPFGKSLSGVGMGNPQPLTHGQLKIVEKSKIEAFKMLTLPHPPHNKELVEALKRIPTIKFVMARLFFPVDANSQFRFTPQIFVDTVINGAQAAYEAGVRWFEVHNEPNLSNEGMGWNWLNGGQFGSWLTQVINLLRPRLPGSFFGYPGLSPQPNVPDFLNTSASAIAACDWVGVHCYWQTMEGGDYPMVADNAGMYWRGFRDRYPDKLLMITEFSCNRPSISYADKGRHYARYYQLLRNERNMAAAFGFALNWPGQDVNQEGWENEQGETDIPGVVGSIIGQPGYLP